MTCLTLNPGHIDVPRALRAWLAAGCRRQPDEALTHAQTAVKLSPKKAGYLDTLAEQ